MQEEVKNVGVFDNIIAWMNKMLTIHDFLKKKYIYTV